MIVSSVDVSLVVTMVHLSSTGRVAGHGDGHTGGWSQSLSDRTLANIRTWSMVTSDRDLTHREAVIAWDAAPV